MAKYFVHRWNFTSDGSLLLYVILDALNNEFTHLHMQISAVVRTLERSRVAHGLRRLLL